ncbi:uncharacterized protein BJ212DRAFT_1578393 [Suillus subaureus]|uniref:Uncharacterized protein n=1 Tax=Suillus subaureus TaxID=48587 RepID=A0A9P7E774_9AGAM|nr:uncharacterized protein BJ212DRAFT_1578393 [Suillus subaureus]KAG1813212.1 hypothetical protein BJ212DRAFT_1578393 [Suillus subaureus]
MSSFSFDFSKVVDPAADKIQHAFTELHAQVVNLADIMPKDRPDLMAHKEEWCHNWVKLLADLEKCSMDSKTHNLSLVLAPEESTKGCKAEEVHVHFHEQIRTFKIEAEHQAKECVHLEEEKQLKEKGKGKEKEATGEDFAMEDGQEEAGEDAAGEADEEEERPETPKHPACAGIHKESKAVEPVLSKAKHMSTLCFLFWLFLLNLLARCATGALSTISLAKLSMAASMLLISAVAQLQAVAKPSLQAAHKAPSTSGSGPTMGSSKDICDLMCCPVLLPEPPIMVSEDKEPDSLVCIEKCKLPEGEDLEDFDLLVDAEASDEDLLMEGQVQALYAKYTLLAPQANILFSSSLSLHGDIFGPMWWFFLLYGPWLLPGLPWSSFLALPGPPSWSSSLALPGPPSWPSLVLLPGPYGLFLLP